MVKLPNMCGWKTLMFPIIIGYAVLFYNYWTCFHQQPLISTTKMKPECDCKKVVYKQEETIYELQQRVQAMQERIKKYSLMEQSYNNEQLMLKNKHASELVECYKVQTKLRELIIKEKDQLLPFGKKLDTIEKVVKDVISIEQDHRDQIAKINGRQFDRFDANKIVHLDFKGAPPTVQFLVRIIRKVKYMGGTGVMLEYENMFPWKGLLEPLAKNNHYSEEEIKLILKAADEEQLDVIPYIPSFSYMDFALKHPRYADLREVNMSTAYICPSKEGSLRLVKEMINQILGSHPKAKWIHLGAQQVRFLKSCDLCKANDLKVHEIYARFLTNLGKYVRTFRTELDEQVQAIIWDDMIRKWSLDNLKLLSRFITPMIWSYKRNPDKLFPKDMWDRYDETFEHVWFASSYKGTSMPWENRVPIQDHIDNTLGWLKIYTDLKTKKLKINGIALMGWSRHDHNAPLCELYPAGLPSLALCLAVLKKGRFDRDLHKSITTYLHFDEPIRLTYEYSRKITPQDGRFQGHKVFHLVGWREKAVGWDEWATVREKGWTRPYYVKHNRINYFYLNETLKDLRSSLVIMNTLKKQAVSDLNWYYFNDTVYEWIEDKIEEPSKFVRKKINFLEDILYRNVLSSQLTEL
ncbi:hexosaminidase D-like [Hydractinia symbiolongicarpus]|uniref:hexosaminidase D-like n=1 Tax=Hydractinia symbiolongicarpus TaxID=13093 RepID=UPI00254DC4FA|nr:hexosaminidase D-like [Hydractinia symbiolongicarpus]